MGIPRLDLQCVFAPKRPGTMVPRFPFEAHQLSMEQAMAYVAPSLDSKSFTCPSCGVLARQYKWGHQLHGPQASVASEDNVHNAPLQVSLCENCGENCIWVRDKFAYPEVSNAPAPNPDMPDDVKADFQEAAVILNKSPRGAAALLRLAIQKLMVHLGQPGKNINSDIAALVTSGLQPQIQQALDVVRVTGNNAVHPGKIDADDVNVAAQLFPLLNIIVESQISFPARINEMYKALPAGSLTAIQARDEGR